MLVGFHARGLWKRSGCRRKKVSTWEVCHGSSLQALHRLVVILYSCLAILTVPGAVCSALLECCPDPRFSQRNTTKVQCKMQQLKMHHAPYHTNISFNPSSGVTYPACCYDNQLSAQQHRSIHICFSISIYIPIYIYTKCGAFFVYFTQPTSDVDPSIDFPRPSL